MPTLAEIEAAAARVAEVIQRTPMQTSRSIAEVLGSPVYLKCENLQRTGSYKIRGAYNRLSRLTPEERARGVVAASAGNHAQGVAFAARELGIKATIFMPVGVALPKLEATRGYGADVQLVGDAFDATNAAAIEFARTTGGVFIPPFDHIDVVAGQGTLGLEIWDEASAPDTIIVPIGGGGLAAGVAAAVKQRAALEGRTVRVIGVQAENAAGMAASVDAGQLVTAEVHPTIADGIAVARPGELTFAIIREHVDEIVTVSDDEIAAALVVLLERAKQVVEPAGAVGVAAVLSGHVQDSGRTAIVLSGGNIDPLLMERVISRGLTASARYLKVAIPLSDRPGQLARISEIIARASANVVEVRYSRQNLDLNINQVEIEIHMETRGPAHQDHVLARLRDGGYEPRVTR
ncbi:MAG: threonine ammonia-lyase [Microbacteriaceae bacterium]|nr:threonine ammonia-lyase [Microbacteriaceae bacterium]